MEELYIQTDYYLGKFFDRLDEGWTILIISDHGQVCRSTIHQLSATQPASM